MDIIDVFTKERFGIAISYNEFKEVGWTQGDFLSYLQFCDKIRACAIVFNPEYGLSIRGLSIIHGNGQHEKNASLRTLGSTALYKAIDELLSFLHHYTDAEFPKEKPSLESLFNSYSYRLDTSQMKVPYFYTYLEDYRPVIEEYIKLYLIGKDYKPPFTIKNKNPKRIKGVNQRIDHIKEELNYLSKTLENAIPEPLPPEKKLHSYLSMLTWVRKQRDFTSRNILQKELNQLRSLQINRTIPAFKQGEHTLYIYGSKGIYCKKERHEIVNVTCHIILANGKKAVINAEYCRDCNKFLLYEGTYNRYRTEYNFLPLILFYVQDATYRSMNVQQLTLSEKSPLALIGYSVSSKKNYSAAQRQQLLSFIIDNGLLSKQKVIEYLEFFIDFHRGRKNFDNATEKWIDDLRFVQSYNMDRQLQANINNIEKYKKR